MLGNEKNADELLVDTVYDQIQNIQNTFPWNQLGVTIFVVEQFLTQIISWALLIVESNQEKIKVPLAPLKNLGPGDQLIFWKHARNILKQNGENPLGKQVRYIIKSLSTHLYQTYTNFIQITKFVNSKRQLQ